VSLLIAVVTRVCSLILSWNPPAEAIATSSAAGPDWQGEAALHTCFQDFAEITRIKKKAFGLMSGTFYDLRLPAIPNTLIYEYIISEGLKLVKVSLSTALGRRP